MEKKHKAPADLPTLKTWRPSGDTSHSGDTMNITPQKAPLSGDSAIELSFGKREEQQARKRQEAQQVAALRRKNEQRREQELERRRSAKAELSELSDEEKKARLDGLKAEKRQQSIEAKREKARRKREYAALSPEEKKEYRKKQSQQKRLNKKADLMYMPKQIVKYALLAVLAAGLIYIGNVVYGMVIDNAYAFGDTGQALTRPVAVKTADPNETLDPLASPTEDPYNLLLSSADLEFMKNRVNILVMGIDQNQDRANWGSFRTDTMIFLSIDFQSGSVYMISLPRDSYVWIYNGNYRSKINTAFSEGGGVNGKGFEYAMKTVSILFGGIPVNHYVCFDMDVVMEVVNAMGGLDYDVDVPFELDGRSLKAGYQHLDGQAVLDYCRVRHITGGSDIARTQRQRAMIMAIFKELKDTNQIQNIPQIYSAVTGNLYTDLTFEQITSLAAFALKADMGNIHECMLEGNYLDIDGTSFWGISQYKKRDLIEEIFGKTIKIDPNDDVNTLLDLVAKKAEAVAAAKAAASDAQSYVNANREYISESLLSGFNERKNTLLTAAAIVNTYNVAKATDSIVAATREFKNWFDGTFKPAVEAARDGSSPTPKPTESSPKPTESSTATSTPEPSESSTATSTT